LLTDFLNFYLTGYPVFLLAKTGNLKLLDRGFEIYIYDQQINIILCKISWHENEGRFRNPLNLLHWTKESAIERGLFFSVLAILLNK
jgi:hypothetical protein